MNLTPEQLKAEREANTLAAQKTIAGWSPEKRASMQLQGSSIYEIAGQAAQAQRAEVQVEGCRHGIAGYCTECNRASAVASLTARVAELEHERDQYKGAFDTWHTKTEWVQQTAKPRELGMHRADVIRNRIAHLEGLCGQAATVIERYRNETPLGHQPHMIAHEADAALASLREKGGV